MQEASHVQHINRVQLDMRIRRIRIVSKTGERRHSRAAEPLGQVPTQIEHECRMPRRSDLLDKPSRQSCLTGTSSCEHHCPVEQHLPIHLKFLTSGIQALSEFRT
jgi:hypothetical protein